MIQIHSVLDTSSITMMDDVSTLDFICLLMKSLKNKTNSLYSLIWDADKSWPHKTTYEPKDTIPCQFAHACMRQLKSNKMFPEYRKKITLE